MPIKGMISFGTKRESSGEVPMKQTVKVDYPCLRLTSDHIPNLGDLKVGSTVYIIAECEIQSIDKGKDYGSEEGFRGEISFKTGKVQVDDDDDDKSPKTIDAAFDTAVKSLKKGG